MFTKNPAAGSLTVTEGVANGLLKVKLGVDGGLITTVVVHLNPFSEDDRLRELDTVFANIDIKEHVILMGDMNALSPEDSYDTEDLLRRFRERGMAQLGAERLRIEVIRKILDAGFTDAVRRCTDSSAQLYTIPTPFSRDLNHSIARFRIDYIFVSPSLRDRIVDARIIINEETDRLSDHYPVSAMIAIPS